MKTKNLNKSKQNLTVLIIFFICFGNILFGQEKTQEKLNVYAVVGVPEIINIGLRYQLGQKQIGIGFFVLPDNDGTNFHISADFLFHLWGESKLSNRRPWYFKTGVNYLYLESEHTIEKSSFLDTRIGRDINISKNIGISIGAGIAFRLFYEEEVKKQSGDWNFIEAEDVPIWPSIGLTVFYRL